MEDPNSTIFSKGGEGFFRTQGSAYVIGGFAYLMWPPPLSLRHDDASDAWDIQVTSNEIEDKLVKWVGQGMNRALYKKSMWMIIVSCTGIIDNAKANKQGVAEMRLVLRALGHKWPKKNFTKEIGGIAVEFVWSPRCAICLAGVSNRKVARHTHDSCPHLATIKASCKREEELPLSAIRFPVVKLKREMELNTTLKLAEAFGAMQKWQEEMEKRMVNVEDTVVSLLGRVEALERLSERAVAKLGKRRSRPALIERAPVMEAGPEEPNADELRVRKRRRALRVEDEVDEE